MGFFSDMREDLSQALNELMQLMPDEQRPKEKRKLKESTAVVPEKDADKKIDAERKLPLNEKLEKLDDFQMSKMEQEQHGVWRDTFESEFLSMAEILDPMDNESSTMSMENNTFEKEDKEENSMELEIPAKGDIPMNEKTPKIEKYGKLFGDWEYKKTLYENKNGTKVLQIYRKGSDWEENCAVKVIPIIDEYGEWDQLPGEIKESYLEAKKENCKKAEKEVRLMYAMRGCSNIVSYYDYAFVEWSEDNRFGCDLLIRMELLDCLRTYIHTKLYSEKEIMKIGIDICRALVQCHKKNIIHRDIKPENVFINEFGDYLLGDFGIARILNNAKKASTSAGTFEYMAPEQMKGNNTENYGSEVDIYSLGLTLYELANEGKLPFAKSIRITQAENALRLSGKKIPLPNSVSEELANIILKACEYDASKRYQSADELLRDLMRLDGEKSENKRKEEEPIVAPNNDVFTISNDDYATVLAETVISPEIISGKDDEENKSVVTEKNVVIKNFGERQKIMVMGIGGAGNNEIDRFLEDDIFLNEIEMVAVNTDIKALDLCKAENKLLLGKNKLNGSGVNANPELAKEAAEESIDDIKCAIEGVELLFLVCGMGGGTGTGATPIIARTAKEMGIVTVALVTTPFRFEDRQRIINAERGVNRLTPYVDTIVVASNDLPLEIFDKDTTMSKALSFMHTFWFTFVDSSRCYLLKKNIFKLFLEGLKGKGLAELSFGMGITAKEAVEDALNQPWIKSKRNSIRSAIYFFEQNISEEDIKELSGLKIPFGAAYLESEDNTEDIIVTTILYTLEQEMEL